MKKLIFPAAFLCLFSLSVCHKDHVSGPGTTTSFTNISTSLNTNASLFDITTVDTSGGKSYKDITIPAC
jgi:hypothetical protein